MYLQLLVLALLLAALWIRKRFAYWKDRGVPYVEPTFPHGNLRGIGSTHHMADIITSVYREVKDRTKEIGFAGMYFFINPVTMVIDLELVKNVLVKDFSYFHDRAVYHNGKVDPLSEHLFAMEGPKWRSLRSKLTPTFTSGKMKMMFPTILAVAEEFERSLTSQIGHGAGGEVEMKDLLARFTTDVIGNCAFGLECNSLKDPHAEFRRMGRKVFQASRMRIMKRFLTSQFKGFATWLGVTITPNDVASFFLGAVKDTVQYRTEHNVKRSDFMSLLMELMEGRDGGKLTLEEASAQAFVFFLAGFETSSTAMSFCLYELAISQDLQDKARICVREALARHGAMTYETLMDMKYIEMCINESLRKYSPAANLLRIATEDYPVPGTKHIIPQGQTVLIPVYAIHHDPDHYPEPDRYDPERFTDEAKAKRNPYAFLPFGEGPRNCIGLRFGMMQARIGMAMLLQHFRFTLAPSMSRPVKVSPSTTVYSIDGGLHLRLEKIQ